jgi:hypothetical protein
MVRAAKAKKNVENNEVVAEKLNVNSTPLKNGEISDLNNMDQPDEEISLNGDSKVKANGKTTKASKVNKE